MYINIGLLIVKSYEVDLLKDHLMWETEIMFGIKSSISYVMLLNLREACKAFLFVTVLWIRVAKFCTAVDD